MTFASTDELFLSSGDCAFPMPALALAPAAWFLGAHMLKCMQEASEKLKAGNLCKSKSLPRHTTVDKGTQTVLSAYREKTRTKKSPTKTRGSETNQTVSAGDKGKSTTARRIPYTTKTTSGGITNELSAAPRTSPSMKHSKSVVAERNRSKTPGSPMLQPTKGRTPKGRRVSTGDCEKRTPASCTDKDMANWLKNPVYASDGESDGRRTDRSDMSPPWLDISVVQKLAGQQKSDDASLSSVIQRVTSKKSKCSARARAMQPKMEVVPEKRPEKRHDTCSKKESVVVEEAVKPPERNLTEMDLTIRRIIEGKMGRRYEELDSKSLKMISEERMKELTAKYAGNRPKIHSADQNAPAPFASRNLPRPGELNDPRTKVADQKS